MGHDMHPQVYCVGSINIDLIFSCQGQIQPRKTVAAKSFSRHIGGKGVNQALAIAVASNASVKFLGIVGKDGAWILEELQKLHFPIDNIIIHPTMYSGHALIQFPEACEQDRAVTVYLGANLAFTQSHVQLFLAGAKKGDIFVLQHETNLIDYMLSVARAKEMVVVYNPSPFPPLVGKDWKGIYQVDWLIMNEEEAKLIFQNTTQIDDALETDLHSWNIAELQLFKEATGAQNIIITIGSRGVLGLIEEGGIGCFYRYPAIPISVVDTTGAGDVFSGFFQSVIYSIHKPLPKDVLNTHLNKVELAFGVASAAAALVISQRGVIDAMPTFDEAANLLLKNLPHFYR